MSQNNQNRDEQEQGEGYQDPNEQEPLERRSDSIDAEPPITETATVRDDSSDDEEDDELDDLDELDDEDREDDQRESGPNRRFNIG